MDWDKAIDLSPAAEQQGVRLQRALTLARAGQAIKAIADTEAVLRHAFERAPLDPEVARRVDERAARITEQVRRTHGVIDDETFQTLLADDES